ncbi:hypothetical protein EV426DRAFT_618103 [Tirmania nivea]|nr:hypothetical protein EV426DRAFT_618103 [Tirmania nivea]
MPNSLPQPPLEDLKHYQLQLQQPLLLSLHISTLIITLILPPFPCRRELSIALIVVTYIFTALKPFSPDPRINYAVASLWVFSLRVLTIHLFSSPSPEAVFYRVGSARKDSDLQGEAKENHKTKKDVGKSREYPNTYGVGLKKLCWVGSLLFSPRGLNWTYQIPAVNPSVLPSTHFTRRSYAVYLFRRLAIIYLLVDAARTFCYTNPSRYILESGSSSPPPGALETIVAALSNGTMSWGFIELLYLLLSVPGIWILGQHPNQWPPLFGGVEECYRVEFLWGRGWHQLLRTTLLPWGDFVRTTLNIKSENAGRVVKVLVAFTLSGFGHANAVYVGSKGMFGRESMLFFTLQALGIFIETGVLNGWRWLRQEVPGEREKHWGRCLGYVWVFGWLSWTSVLQAGDMRRLGLAREDPVPWSLIRWGLGWPQKFEGV